MDSKSSSAPASVSLAIRLQSAPIDHNQFIKDPLAHFRAIPWCATLLNDGAVLNYRVCDRRPLPSTESSFVRRVMNSGTTVRACITFCRMVNPPPSGSGKASIPAASLSRSGVLLSGGGKANGEDLRNPFLLLSALLDLGEDLCGYTNTLHGGLFTVLMDEVMGTAANFQADHGAYTAQLTTKYRRTIKTPQVVLVRGRVVRKEGRKIFVKGTIEDKDGESFFCFSSPR